MRTRLAGWLVGTALGFAACSAEVPVTSTGPASTEAVASPVDDGATSVLPPPLPPPPQRPATTDPDPVAPLPAGEDTTIEEVVDGDTVVASGGTRIRLIGIDSPETRDPRRPVQCFGVEAARHTGELIGPGTPVRLVHDVERFDRFGRALAYVYRLGDGLFVNAALVADGYAVPATYPPNVAHAEELAALAGDARRAGRGLWGACHDERPAAPTTVAPSTAGAEAGCDPSYPGVCIAPAPPDLDCGHIADRRFAVVGPDPHRFDGDGDGVGCEG